MGNYEKHLYAIMHPNHSLVASQLGPEEFGKHYAIGSARYFKGKMLFFEVDEGYRNDYFPIDEYLEKTVEHPDGRPKKTKFISSYRVLEHLSLEALPALYAMTVSGHVLRMDRQESSEVEETEQVRLYQEINPVQMLCAATLSPAEFGKYVVRPEYPKGAPAVFFTQFELDVSSFLQELESTPFVAPPVEGIHPQMVGRVVRQLMELPDGRVRSIGLKSLLPENSYRRIRHGFWVARGDELNFYRFPSESELRTHHYDWWRTMA